MGFQDNDDKEALKPILAKPDQSSPPSQPLPQAEEWSTGLCDCCSEPGGYALGCVSAFMPCVQFGLLSEQVNKESKLTGTFCGAASAFVALDVVAALAHCNLWPGVSLLPTSALLHLPLRSEIRRKYNIKGSCLGDLCTTWWCGPCALAQETREFVLRSAQQQQQLHPPVNGAAASAPAPPPYLWGYMVMPRPVATAPSVPVMAPPPPPMATPSAAAVPVAQPATGIPVAPLPPTQVATVTLGPSKAMPA